mmetsp:Transcript_40476/g.72750  ORF Transcript_40476/g.72750 Transcript_40476/m.72750 type:complete len:899 (+) Transcript_40476:62-2758(+)
MVGSIYLSFLICRWITGQAARPHAEFTDEKASFWDAPFVIHSENYPFSVPLGQANSSSPECKCVACPSKWLSSNFIQEAVSVELESAAQLPWLISVKGSIKGQMLYEGSGGHTGYKELLADAKLSFTVGSSPIAITGTWQGEMKFFSLEVPSFPMLLEFGIRGMAKEAVSEVMSWREKLGEKTFLQKTTEYMRSLDDDFDIEEGKCQWTASMADRFSLLYTTFSIQLTRIATDAIKFITEELDPLRKPPLNLPDPSLNLPDSGIDGWWHELAGYHDSLTQVVRVLKDWRTRYPKPFHELLVSNENHYKKDWGFFNRGWDAEKIKNGLSQMLLEVQTVAAAKSARSLARKASMTFMEAHERETDFEDASGILTGLKERLGLACSDIDKQSFVKLERCPTTLERTFTTDAWKCYPKFLNVQPGGPSVAIPGRLICELLHKFRPSSVADEALTETPWSIPGEKDVRIPLAAIILAPGVFQNLQLYTVHGTFGEAPQEKPSLSDRVDRLESFKGFMSLMQEQDLAMDKLKGPGGALPMIDLLKWETFRSKNATGKECDTSALEGWLLDFPSDEDVRLHKEAMEKKLKAASSELFDPKGDDPHSNMYKFFTRNVGQWSLAMGSNTPIPAVEGELKRQVEFISMQVFQGNSRSGDIISLTPVAKMKAINTLVTFKFWGENGLHIIAKQRQAQDCHDGKGCEYGKTFLNKLKQEDPIVVRKMRLPRLKRTFTAKMPTGFFAHDAVVNLAMPMLKNAALLFQDPASSMPEDENEDVSKLSKMRGPLEHFAEHVVNTLSNQSLMPVLTAGVLAAAGPELVKTRTDINVAFRFPATGPTQTSIFVGTTTKTTVGVESLGIVGEWIGKFLPFNPAKFTAAKATQFDLSGLYMVGTCAHTTLDLSGDIGD